MSPASCLLTTLHQRRQFESAVTTIATKGMWMCWESNPGPVKFSCCFYVRSRFHGWRPAIGILLMPLHSASTTNLFSVKLEPGSDPSVVALRVAGPTRPKVLRSCRQCHLDWAVDEARRLALVSAVRSLPD